MAALPGMPSKFDGVVCCLGCLSLLPNVKKQIVNKVAFFPPKPAGYFISDDRQVFLVDHDESLALLELPDLSQDGITVDTIRLTTRKNSTIFAFHFRRPDATKTIIFSHGNSTDIGIMFFHFQELSRNLNVNLFAYEYTGYGLSSGSPSEKHLYSDITAAYQYLTNEAGVPASTIVAYGQSVGSAPTVYLASTQPLAGVVLHSALSSGLAVVHEVSQMHWFDVFRNLETIKTVTCPVFIMHGMADTEVPFEHGLALYKNAGNAVEPWWVEGGEHNNIEVHWADQYFVNLQDFLEHLGVPKGKRPKQQDMEGHHHHHHHKTHEDPGQPLMR